MRERKRKCCKLARNYIIWSTWIAFGCIQQISAFNIYSFNFATKKLHHHRNKCKHKSFIILQASTKKQIESTSSLEVNEADTSKKGANQTKREINGNHASKRKVKNVKDTPLYWILNDDEVIQTKNKDDQIQLKFTIHGKPVPLRRHRTSRGFVYNPSAKAQKSFQDALKTLSISEDLVFQEDDFIHMKIIFRLRRPRKHFIGNKAGPGRLRESASNQLVTGRVDVDNLAKFVLDSLNGIIYPDDRQVISLHVMKIFDSEGDCEGSTEILIQSMKDEDMNQLLQ